MELVNYALNYKLNSKRIRNEVTAEKNAYLEDRYRIINSIAFRRLEYKTQVFINHAGDHYRTRLTHTLEAAHLAKTLSRQLQINEDLAECIILAHDIGHPPFGHAGENALNRVMERYGGFNHNLHTMKILTQLETFSPEFNGLNLTTDTLDGILKHNGPIDKDSIEAQMYLSEVGRGLGLDLNEYPSLEAQVAAIVDDIAYCTHDIDDGIRAGFISLEDILNLELNYLYDKSQHELLSDKPGVKQFIRALVSTLTADVLYETRRRINFYQITEVYDIYNCDTLLACFSEEVGTQIRMLKEFLMQNVYTDYRVSRTSMKGRKMITEMFNHLMQYPQCLSPHWISQDTIADEKKLAISIKDYIAGMTDRFAIEEYRRLFDPIYY